jgi:hypothetical protein
MAVHKDRHIHSECCGSFVQAVYTYAQHCSSTSAAEDLAVTRWFWHTVLQLCTDQTCASRKQDKSSGATSLTHRRAEPAGARWRCRRASCCACFAYIADQLLPGSTGGWMNLMNLQHPRRQAVNQYVKRQRWVIAEVEQCRSVLPAQLLKPRCGSCSDVPTPWLVSLGSAAEVTLGNISKACLKCLQAFRDDGLRTQ